MATPTERAAASGAAKLYTPDILALAVELAAYPLTNGTLQGEAHSRICGSSVTIGLSTGSDGSIDQAGARVKACAIGQAAAALFLSGAKTRTAADLAAALRDLEDWLGGGEAEPAWPGIAILSPARSHPARHAAILLPWKAALAALSNPARAD